MRKIARGLTLSPETWTRIEKIAQESKRTTTEVTRMLIEERLALYPQWGLAEDELISEFLKAISRPKKARDGRR
jgi:hypothetical protein